MKKWIFVVVLFSGTALSSAQAADEVPSGPRLALLIGNSQYSGFAMKGVDSSLDRVEQALDSRGFRVLRRENLGEQELKDAVDVFAKSVPTGGVALVYYIGLGAHVERLGKWHNLLRPTGVDLKSDNDYRGHGLNVADVIQSLREDSGSRVNLIFLDACWESPIRPAQGSVLGGLRAMEVDPGTLVAFGADSGQMLPAPENDDPSALAAALARHVPQLEKSLKAAGQAISKDAGSAWIGGGSDAGIGGMSELPLVESPNDGKTPGTGLINSIGMTLRWCPAASFTMGSLASDAADTRDRKPVEATLSKGFWMGQHEVTQREYSIVMKKNVTPGFTTQKNAPFWGVGESKQITDFCAKLNDIERKAGTLPNGWGYVCPTEAEWEYACRAGSRTAFCFGDAVSQLGAYGNFADAALRDANPDYYWAEGSSNDGIGEALAPAGSYRPNAWGLCDMHGNVAEVVADHLVPERTGGTDPLIRVEKGGTTQTRGGAWCSLPLYCESSFRNAAASGDKCNFIGFRVALRKVK